MSPQKSTRPRLNTASVFNAVQDDDNAVGVAAAHHAQRDTEVGDTAPAEQPARQPAEVDDDAAGDRADLPPRRAAARASTPRQRRTRGPVGGGQRGVVAGLGALPIPATLDVGTTKPLNVRVSGTVHFQMKLATTALGIDMQEVVGALVTAFTHDPELVAQLIRRADDEAVTFGELVHDALLDLNSHD